jgi:hypothetical protein
MFDENRDYEEEYYAIFEYLCNRKGVSSHKLKEI